jgi:hypothetical protein
MPKVMIEVEIPEGKIDEAIYAVKKHFSPDWMCEWWHIDDVIEQAENHNEQLTEEEARQVLKYMDKFHDCNYGHTWDSMDSTIDIVLQQRKEVA